MAPLPPEETSPEFNVSWSGTDSAASSAISSYTIYVSDNGGPYTAWLTNTTLTAAPYQGQLGHTYAFYSVATDNAGNVEPPRQPPRRLRPCRPESDDEPLNRRRQRHLRRHGRSDSDAHRSGAGVSNEPVSFTFNNGTTITPIGTATTDADGVATLTDVSLAGIAAGTYAGYVGASFAGDTTYDASSGSGDLTSRRRL